MRQISMNIEIQAQYNNAVNEVKKYREKIEKLPKGSISVKTRGKNAYLYLTYRENNKIISEYVGNVESDKAIEILAQIKERKEYEKLLKYNENIKNSMEKQMKFERRQIVRQLNKIKKE